jgi:hypothetical protein
MQTTKPRMTKPRSNASTPAYRRGSLGIIDSLANAMALAVKRARLPAR